MRTRTHTQPSSKRRRAGIHAMLGILVAVALSLLGFGVVANAASELDISITTNFSPANATIQTGTTVTWTNNDSQTHELRSTSGPAEFRTNPLSPGQKASFTFNTPGTYTYLDHQNDKSAAYRGTIVVTDAAVPATPPPASTPPPANTPPAPSTAAVHLAGAQFSPTTVTVAVGGTVTWTNNDASKHTVTADDASFDSATLNSGATFAHTFTAPGTYPYGCDFHGNMRGTVIVTAAGSPAPAPAPVPPAPVPPAPVAPAPVPNPPTPPVAAPPAAPAPGATPTNESININNNSFAPSTITVNVGSTITWSNGDTVTHTVTADDQSFTSGLLKKATSWSHTFATAGTFTYFCEIHPDMTGTVIARAADGTAPPAAAPPTNNVAQANNTSAAAATTAGASSTANGSGSAAAAGPTTGSIAITDSGFTPASFRLAVGGTLTFANNGKAAHTVTATDGSFDSDMIRSGGTWAHTFNTAGTFSYHCILHPTMKGTVQVVGVSSGGSNNSSGGASTAAAGMESQAAASATDATTTSVESRKTSALLAVAVDVVDNQFNPAAATVAQGGTVTWKLSGEAAHTITGDDQSFNSGIVKPGDSFQYTFTEVGTFTYMCMIHPGMTGTINVVTPDQAAAQPAAAAAVTPPQQPGSGQTAAAGTGPARDANLWGNTLVGLAAVLLACCALVFALRSFLKILGVSEADASGATPATSENLTPHPI